MKREKRFCCWCGEHSPKHVQCFAGGSSLICQARICDNCFRAVQVCPDHRLSYEMGNLIEAGCSENLLEKGEAAIDTLMARLIKEREHRERLKVTPVKI